MDDWPAGGGNAAPAARADAGGGRSGRAGDCRPTTWRQSEGRGRAWRDAAGRVVRCRAAWARALGRETCVVHGDPNPRNIRITPERVALIDWDEAHVDVPDLDLALPNNVAGLDEEAYDSAAAGVCGMGSGGLLGRRSLKEAAGPGARGLTGGGERNGTRGGEGPELEGAVVGGRDGQPAIGRERDPALTRPVWPRGGRPHFERYAFQRCAARGRGAGPRL